jgi:hypothetical protein
MGISNILLMHQHMSMADGWQATLYPVYEYLDSSAASCTHNASSIYGISLAIMSVVD